MKCKVCGDDKTFHVPNSHICKLVLSGCKHEWSKELFNSSKAHCKTCGEGYRVPKCTKCGMLAALHWSELFFHDEGGCVKI